MAIHIFDSHIFQNAWCTRELRDLFDERNRVQGWIKVMAVLAEIEGKYNLIPGDSANDINETCSNLKIDQSILEEARIGFEETNHSLLGLIHAVQRRCPGKSGEWLCYGVSVQDITDTHLIRTLKSLRKILISEIEDTRTFLGEMVSAHKYTLISGRTHGQPGLPITFGFKAAGWLDEFQRHDQRLSEIAVRMDVGQLCGGIGSMSSLGKNAVQIQADFCRNLGLKVPAISWTSSRDRLAEWSNLLAMITATCDRIGHEIYNLQRPEIGEISEGFSVGTVGSITMPQKRNPEISEHLGTLSRIVRHAANHMMENLVHDHERDGRSWKSEWVIIPEICIGTEKSLSMLNRLLKNLDVRQDRMLKNLQSNGGLISAEAIMLRLAQKIGKQTAHQIIYDLCSDAQEREIPLQTVIAENSGIRQHLTQVGSSRVDLQACKLEYSIVSPK